MNYVIEKKATIENAAALHEDLSKWFSMDDIKLTIDLSSTETVDYSFIQLLVFLGKKTSETEKSIEIKNDLRESFINQLGEMYLLSGNANPVEVLNGFLGDREKQ